MPKDCIIPFNASNTAYEQTVYAIQYIIENRLDTMCQFELLIAEPRPLMPDGTHWDQFSGSKWIPLVNFKPTYVVKTALLRKITQENCLNEINNISLRSNSPSHGSELTNENTMATEKSPRARKTGTAAIAATESALEAATPTSLESAFVHPKQLVQEGLTKILAYKSVTTTAEAEGLKNAMLSLNTTLKQVEKVRKTLKQPYLDGCKLVDDVAKQITDNADEAVNNAKKILYDFDVLQRRAAEDAAKEADKKRQEEARKAEEEASKISFLAKGLEEFEKRVSEKIIDCRTLDTLGKVYTENLSEFFPVESTHGALLQNALELKERLMALGFAKDAVIKADESLKLGKIGPESHAEVIESPMKVINQYAFAYNKAKEALLNTTTAAVEEVQVEAEMAKAEITGQQIMTQPTLNIQVRRTCRFELTDVMQLAQAILAGQINPAFLMLNEAEVKAWAKQQNESENPLTHGEYINGITFYWDETPVMPRS